MIDIFAVLCYIILIVAAIYGLFFGFIKILTPIASGALSLIVMLALRKWAFVFLFRWAVFQGEHILARIVVILLVFFIGSFLFRWMLRALNLIARLPIIHGFNKILGCFSGLFAGAMIVWLFMYLVNQFPTQPLSVTCMRQIYSAPILIYLYEHNFVLFLFELFTDI